MKLHEVVAHLNLHETIIFSRPCYIKPVLNIPVIVMDEM